MKFKISVCVGVIVVLSSCTTVPVLETDRCMSYITSGDNVEWTPVKYYQSYNDNSLYIQFAPYVVNIPELQVQDGDFDTPDGVAYTYNSKTHTIKVRDNYNKYILSRVSPNNTDLKQVFIQCNRTIPIVPINDVDKSQNKKDK